MVEKYLSETDIRKLLQCSRCKAVPSAPPVHICKTGHLECSSCFAKFAISEETDASTDSECECASARKEESHVGVIFPRKGKCRTVNHICAVCKEEVLKTRNLLAETLIFQLENWRGEKGFYPCGKDGVPDSNYADCCYNIYGQPFARFDAPNVAVTAYETQAYSRYQVPCGGHQYPCQMDPYSVAEVQLDYGASNSVFYPDYECSSYYNGRRDVNEKRSRYNFVPQSSVLSLSGEPSRRPIRCPTHLCGRNIAVAALSSHFSFDHPDVPPVSVDFDVSSQLFVVPDMIPFNYGRCVALLLIPTKYDAMSSASQATVMNPPSKRKNSMPLVVMASKLDCVTNPKMPTSGDACQQEEQKADTPNHGDHRVQENVKSPLLVIWLAGIEANSSIFTTLQVTEKQTNIRSVVYTGPVTSLRSSQNTTKVFEQGDCLVIHSGILENIIGDRGGFDLHIVVH